MCIFIRGCGICYIKHGNRGDDEMISKRIILWEAGTYQGSMEDEFQPNLNTYVLDGIKKRPAVLICPGGAYGHTSEREAEAVAIQFNAQGYHAFVLYYSVSPRRHPQPINDLSRAMCIIRESAEEFHIDIDKIAVCGFSAGGHLAASLGVYWDKEYLLEACRGQKGINKPNALILSYPVITSGEFAHRGSFDNLLGEDASEEKLYEMSLEHHVSKITPPVFIWHTFDDSAVPVENTLLFANGLRKNNIPFEMHIYPQGVHGLSLSTKETDIENEHAASWVGLCMTWLKSVFI
jgi:acetyl esterase/lipase